MTKFGIVVDSSCDLQNVYPAQQNTEAVFCRVPLKLQVGDKVFVDDSSLDVGRFMGEMSAYSGKTSSAAPGPGEWCAAFERAEEIFAVTISSKVSASYSSAVAARDIMLEKQPDKKIFVLDSKSAGPGLSLLVMKIKDLIANGNTFEEIVEKIKIYQKSAHLFFVLESLDNLMKNGRVSKIQARLAGLLGIKILGFAGDEGTLEILEKCRGKLTAYKVMVDQMFKRGFKGSDVIISHCFNEENAAYVHTLLKKAFPKSKISIMPTGGLCSYYAEKGGLLLAFEGNER